VRSRFGPCLAPDVAACRTGRPERCGADSCRLRLGPRGRRLARRVQGQTCGAQLVRISLFREAPAAYRRGPRCRRRRRGAPWRLSREGSRYAARCGRRHPRVPRRQPPGGPALSTAPFERLGIDGGHGAPGAQPGRPPATDDEVPGARRVANPSCSVSFAGTGRSESRRDAHLCGKPTGMTRTCRIQAHVSSKEPGLRASGGVAAPGIGSPGSLVAGGLRLLGVDVGMPARRYTCQVSVAAPSRHSGTGRRGCIRSSGCGRIVARKSEPPVHRRPCRSNLCAGLGGINQCPIDRQWKILKKA
jgi:hypothetical protein